MKAICLDGKNLTIGDVVNVSRYRAPVCLESKPRVGIIISYQELKKHLAKGRLVYGVNTGFGKNVTFLIPLEKLVEHQKHLLYSLACGTNPFLTPAESRAVILTRANSLAKGYSAVRVLVIEKMLDLLNKGISPLIPRYGSVGASGDLVPSAYIGLALIGEGRVWHQGKILPVTIVYEKTGFAPITLEPKEGLAIVNSTAVTCGLGALFCHDFEYLLKLITVCEALYIETMKGMKDFLNPLANRLKNNPGQKLEAAYLRAILKDSRLTQSYKEVAARALSGAEEDIQDPYSLRISPQGLGPAWDELTVTKKRVTEELNAASDNPLISPENGEIIHNGNFLGVNLTLRFDTMKNVTAYLAIWLQAIMERILDPKKNKGLPPNLSQEAGFNSGFKGLGLSAASYTAEICQMATPHLIFSRSTESDNQDVVSMCTLSVEKAHQQLELLRNLTARVLIALCQAAEFRNPENLAPATRKIYNQVRSRVAFRQEDAAGIDNDIKKIKELIKKQKITLPQLKAAN